MRLVVPQSILKFANGGERLKGFRRRRCPYWKMTFKLAPAPEDFTFLVRIPS